MRACCKHYRETILMGCTFSGTVCTSTIQVQEVEGALEEFDYLEKVSIPDVSGKRPGRSISQFDRVCVICI